MRFLRPLAGLAALLALAGCSGASLLNAVTSRAGYALERNLRYAPGARGTLDLYVPADVRPDTPLVVFVYGGAWDSGSKDIYRFVGQSLAKAGIAVAVPDYRLYPEVVFPRFVEDAAKAVAAVEKAGREGTEGLPAGRHPLFLMGHSAGGEIAGLLATDPRYLRAVGLSKRRLAGFIGLAGPYDFLPLKEERYKRVFPVETREDSQPVHFVDGTEPPMLLLAGSDDTTVNPENTRSLARHVVAKGGTAEAAILPGADHIAVLSGLATALPVGERSVRARVLDFIGRHS
ncbi:alpha/beta hydrolase [Aureimonas leprariae]|uniref:Alpha/beta hydrolase n=1 Tax=Plantimonas leprariae TaxID=2615207 RepID=A0A7V7PME1_9HYPH|nr:alpha/beta hydrolase [Aureimonas leprariae]KAB0677986.1 alpha/beta hydrolase [Aureimonas leprariae]